LTVLFAAFAAKLRDLCACPELLGGETCIEFYVHLTSTAFHAKAANMNSQRPQKLPLFTFFTISHRLLPTERKRGTIKLRLQFWLP